MARASLRNWLFRLIIALKLMMWAAIAAVLVISIRDAVRGREAGPPMDLIYAIAALILAQLIAFLAWHRTGRRK